MSLLCPLPAADQESWNWRARCQWTPDLPVHQNHLENWKHTISQVPSDSLQADPEIIILKHLHRLQQGDLGWVSLGLISIWPQKDIRGSPQQDVVHCVAHVETLQGVPFNFPPSSLNPL